MKQTTYWVSFVDYGHRPHTCTSVSHSLGRTKWRNKSELTNKLNGTNSIDRVATCYIKLTEPTEPTQEHSTRPFASTNNYWCIQYFRRHIYPLCPCLPTHKTNQLYLEMYFLIVAPVNSITIIAIDSYVAVAVVDRV